MKGKIALFIIMSVTSIFMFTGCATCKLNTKCNEYQQYTPCGSYIRHPCEIVCHYCRFNEPDCYDCRACLNYDGCGIGTPA